MAFRVRNLDRVHWENEKIAQNILMKSSLKDDRSAAGDTVETHPEWLGVAIRTLREKARLSPGDVADRIGVPYQNFRYLERRCSPMLWSRHGEDLAAALETTPAQILNLAHELQGRQADPEEEAPGVDADADHEAERSELGRRAKERRKELNLSASSVAEQIGITSITLSAWERAFPRKLSKERAQSWADALRVPSGWLFDMETQLPLAQTRAPVELSGRLPRTVASEIQDIAAWLTESSILRRKPDWRQLADNRRLHAMLFCLRYGMDGDARTFVEVGQRQNVTKERAHQVCSRMVERAKDHLFVTPQIDRLVEEVLACLPAPLDVLEREFRGKLGLNQSLRGLHDFLTEVLGTHPFFIRRSEIPAPDGSVVYLATKEGEESSTERNIFELCRRMIRHVGAAQSHTVYGLYADESPPVEFSDFLRIVKALPGFEWLSERSGWFWFGHEFPVENRIIRCALKIASVAEQRVDVESVLAAIDRSRRSSVASEEKQEILLDAPRQVVLQVLVQSGRFRLCQHDDIEPSEEVSPASILSDTEMKIHDALKRRGGVASWSEIKAEVCDEKNTALPTLQFALRNSAIVTAIDFGLYRLIGHSLASDLATRSVQNWRSLHTPAAPMGTRADEPAVMYFNLEVRESMLESGNLDLPPVFVPYVLKMTPYAIAESHHAVMIAPSRKHGHLRGDALVKVMRDRNYRPGDQIRVFLHPAQRQFSMELLAKFEGEQ